MLFAKCSDAGCIFGIQTAAVRQYQADTCQGVIGVLRGAAAHAAGIVGDNAANFAGIDRRRVRPDLAPERCQPGIGLCADHAGLQADLRALRANLAAVPIVTQYDQHRIADGLAGQAGARGAECHGDTVTLGELQQRHHFLFRFHANHQLWDQSVKTGVGAEGERGKWIVEATIFWDQLCGVAQKSSRQAHRSSRNSRRRNRVPASILTLLRAGLSAPAYR